jgi:hypothetical protein
VQRAPAGNRRVCAALRAHRSLPRACLVRFLQSSSDRGSAVRPAGIVLQRWRNGSNRSRFRTGRWGRGQVRLAPSARLVAARNHGHPARGRLLRSPFATRGRQTATRRKRRAKNNFELDSAAGAARHFFATCIAQQLFAVLLSCPGITTAGLRPDYRRVPHQTGGSAQGAR